MVELYIFVSAIENDMTKIKYKHNMLSNYRKKKVYLPGLNHFLFSNAFFAQAVV